MCCKARSHPSPADLPWLKQETSRYNVGLIAKLLGFEHLLTSDLLGMLSHSFGSLILTFGVAFSEQSLPSLIRMSVVSSQNAARASRIRRCFLERCDLLSFHSSADNYAQCPESDVALRTPLQERYFQSVS